MLTNNQHISQICIKIQKKMGQIPFDYNFLLSKLHEYHFPRNKIGTMIKSGEIIRIKKGLYIISPEYSGSAHRFLLANLIFGPSYVSLESALAYWGMIPEQVNMVTCVTSKRNKRFNTPVGVFSYRHISPGSYSVGLTRIKNDNDGSSFLMATPEKALCDRAGVVHLKSIKETGDFVEEGLRIDREELRKLNPDDLLSISESYPGRSVKLLYRWYRKAF
jgi:hypothetical protein